MRVRSVRRQIRLLQITTVCSTMLAAVALLGAAQAVRQVSFFDTITTHRINVVDREGKLAMVIASHDDEATPIIHGYRGRREQGNHADNGIIFFNQRGDEQGGLVWNAALDRSHSGDSLSFDTANTDQLIHVEDGDDNGHHYADVIGWQRAANEEATIVPLIRELDAAHTPAQRQAVMAKLRVLPGAPTRFFLGYDERNVSRLNLDDAQGHPRIRLFVDPDGTAKLQFLDAAGHVTYELPHS
jgi:hypothetical protein